LAFKFVFKFAFTFALAFVLVFIFVFVFVVVTVDVVGVIVAVFTVCGVLPPVKPGWVVVVVVKGSFILIMEEGMAVTGGGGRDGGGLFNIALGVVGIEEGPNVVPSFVLRSVGIDGYRELRASFDDSRGSPVLLLLFRDSVG